MESLIGIPCVLPTSTTTTSTTNTEPTESFEGILAEAVIENGTPESKEAGADQKSAAETLQALASVIAPAMAAQLAQTAEVAVPLNMPSAQSTGIVAPNPIKGKHPPGSPLVLGAPTPKPPGESVTLDTASPPLQGQLVEGKPPPPTGEIVESILPQIDTVQTVDARPEMTGGLKAQTGLSTLPVSPNWQAVSQAAQVVQPEPVDHAVPVATSGNRDVTAQAVTLTPGANVVVQTPENLSWQLEATAGPVPPGKGVPAPTAVNTVGTTTWLAPELGAVGDKVAAHPETAIVPGAPVATVAEDQVVKGLLPAPLTLADVEAFHAVVQVSLAHGVNLVSAQVNGVNPEATADANGDGVPATTLPQGVLHPTTGKPIAVIHQGLPVQASATETKSVPIPDVKGIDSTPIHADTASIKSDIPAAAQVASEASGQEAVSHQVAVDMHPLTHLDSEALNELGKQDRFARLRTESVIEGVIHNLGNQSEDRQDLFHSGSDSPQGEAHKDGSLQEASGIDGTETKLQFPVSPSHSQSSGQTVGSIGSVTPNKSIHQVADSGNAALRQSLINQMMEKMDVDRLRQSVQQATIDLNPAHLGRMRIVMQMDSERVAASVQADNPVVRQALESSKEQLRSALESKGFSLGSLDIGFGFGAPKDQPQAQNNSRGQQFTQTLQRLEQAHEVLRQGWQPQLAGGVRTADHLDYRA